MRVLITGATGLVGKQLVKACHRKDIDVHYLTTTKDHLEHTPHYKGYLWDVKKGEIDSSCLDGVDTIVHLAGASIAKRWTDEHKQEVIESRINTANLLLKTLEEKKNQVKHFVSASAIGAYPSSYETLYTEEYPEYNPGFLGKVVKAWEAAADQFKELDLAVTKVRIGVVMAEDGGALQQLTKPVEYNVGAPLGSGKQWQSWIHLEDLARIFVHCIKHKLEGVYNAVAPSPVTNAEMTKTSAKILDKAMWLPNVPASAIKLMMGEMAAIVLESQKVSSAKIQESGYQFQYTEIKEALQDLLE